MKLESAIVAPLFNYLWRFKLTRFGKVLVLFGVFSGMFVAWSIEILTFHLFAVMFCIGFFAFTINLLWRTRLHIEVTLPDKIVAGATVSGAVRIRNVGRLPAYEVGVSFFNLPSGLRERSEERYVAVLPPGAAATLPIVIEALRRGSHGLPPLRAFSAFPLRLLRSGRSHQAVGNLLALPAFTPAESIDVPVSRRYQPGGVALTAHVGESPEYIGNREFRPGDSIRRLDMRAWGRVGAPIVREYQEEYFLRLALVLDTYSPRIRRLRAPVAERLEAAISLTATIVDALSRGEYLLDIFAAGPELYNFRTGKGASQFDSVLEILACIEACRTNPFDSITPALADELGNISTVVFVFLDWDAARAEMVRTAVERGCRARIFIINEGETTTPAVADEEHPITVMTPAMARGEGARMV